MPRASSLLRNQSKFIIDTRINVPEDRMEDFEVIVFREGIDLGEERLEGLRMMLLFKD